MHKINKGTVTLCTDAVGPRPNVAVVLAVKSGPYIYESYISGHLAVSQIRYNMIQYIVLCVAKS